LATDIEVILDKLFEARDRMIPADGYNLVGIDYSKDIGDELYLISHHDTFGEALDAKEKCNNKDTVIYPEKREM
jgi:hypothetical protein